MIKNPRLILWSFQSLFSCCFPLLGLYFLVHANSILFWKEGVFLSALIASLLSASLCPLSLPLFDFIDLIKIKSVRGSLLFLLFLTLGNSDMKWLPFAVYPLIALSSREEGNALNASLLLLILLDCIPMTSSLLHLPFASFSTLIEALFALLFFATVLHRLKKKYSLLHLLVLLFLTYTLMGRCPILNLLFFLSYGLLFQMQNTLSLFIPLLLLFLGRTLGLAPFLTEALILSFLPTLTIVTFLQTLTKLLKIKK